MLVLSVRESSKIEIRTPSGTITLTFWRKDGKQKVGVEMAGIPWPVVRTNNGMTDAEARIKRQERKAMEKRIEDLRFGITQAGLDFLAKRMEVVK